MHRSSRDQFPQYLFCANFIKGTTSRALFMVLVLQPGHRFEKKEGTRNTIGLLFACPFDCFFNEARSSAPINICIRVHIIFKKSYTVHLKCEHNILISPHYPGTSARTSFLAACSLLLLLLCLLSDISSSVLISQCLMSTGRFCFYISRYSLVSSRW